jgi:hypothetical protein
MKFRIVFVCACLFLLSHHAARAFYNECTGRWLSRDPIGERGSANLTVFCSNDGLASYDFLGLYDCVTSCTEQCALAGPGAPQCVIYCEEAKKKMRCPTTYQNQPCGRVITRANGPYFCVVDALTRFCTPHQFIVTAGGEGLTFGGDATGEDHWTASKEDIFPKTGTTCEAFSKCLSDFFKDKNNQETYSSIGNNCQDTVRGALQACGGNLKK